MRVLYVHSGNLFGGVESLMLTLLESQSLCPEMEQYFALCFEGKFSEELTKRGAEVHPLGNVRVSRPLSVRRARRNLKNLLSEKQFDVVVVHSAWSQLIFASVVRSFKLPLVFWVHDVPDGMPWPERFARWSQPPDLVICNSKYTAARLPKLYRDVPSRLIYCPVAPNNSTYSDEELKKLRAEFQTPDDAVVILQISRLEPHKGHFVQLDALAMMGAEPNWICWMVGGVQKPDEVRYLGQLKDKAKQLGIDSRVRFLGWQADVQKVIAASDIYCQPNLYPEPFGLTFIEALYSQKPILGTSLGGPKEIIDDSCGFLVPPNEPLFLSRTLRTLIQNDKLRKRLGDAGPRRAQALCDPARQTRMLHQSFLSITTNGCH